MLDLLVTFSLIASCSAKLIDLSTSGSQGQTVLANKTFDYIIVGGGTAGLTVAERLSEDSSKTVLVLEAGGSGVGQDLVTIPGNSFHFIGTAIDWLYSIAPQAHAAGQKINLSSGKILGGDSAINGLVWVRGAKEEYDALEALGSPGWNWAKLYPYMKKVEKLNKPSADLVSEYGYVIKPSSLGSSGPVDLSFPAFLPLQHTKLVEASMQLGHTFNTDAYSGNNTGVFYSLSSQTTVPKRETSEFAYLTPHLSRSNLVVMTFATVAKVNLKSVKGGMQASSVQVLFPDGKEYVASLKSTGECILSAGVVRTPQILELSGIGSPSILKPLGIDVKVNSTGVGKHYEDHTLTIMTYQLKPGFDSNDALSYNATLLAEQQELYTEGKGFLTFAQGVTNFEPIDKILTPAEMKTAKKLLATKPASLPQSQFDIIKSQILGGTPQVEFILFNSFSGGEVKLPNTSYISLAITHVHPMSRGSIHINSTNITDIPTIDLNVLESEWDRWFLAKATAYGRKFFQTPAFQEIVEPEEVFPGNTTETEADWVKFVKNTVNAAYHSVGTAALLPRSQDGVVDPNLKVYGTTNLRVADLSIMPLLFSAHTQPLAYTVGERAAAIIKGKDI
ncbi:hypothetical protein C8J56DRAFT_538926 [Mycena floridula]|nr:hypothetical protein C8J56DRAFT_538926 [Mycena floridula]